MPQQRGVDTCSEQGGDNDTNLRRNETVFGGDRPSGNDQEYGPDNRLRPGLGKYHKSITDF